MLIVILLGLSTVAVIFLLLRTVWAVRRFRYRPAYSDVNVHNLPSISVCIAARNETHALAQCLERVLRSDYPKLEVLVLDDSSSDDTSLIIKSFAQAGVRFIAGKALPPGWLGKNYAYQTLIDESSGEYVLFLDVDTVISTTTISQLTNQLLANKRSMISVLPRRVDSYRTSALFGTMRYYWELLLSTRTNPPAASALWMVRQSTLDEAGIGLANYGMSVRPERHLARQLQKQKNYYYLIGSRKLGISYEKRVKSQYETALRLYYPMSGRGFLPWLIAVLYVSLLIAPLLVSLMSGPSSLYIWLWSVSLCVFTAITFGLFAYTSYGSFAWFLRVCFGPLLLVQELILLTLSYLLYRMNKISWKGRLVTAQPTRHDALRIDE